MKQAALIIRVLIRMAKDVLVLALVLLGLTMSALLAVAIADSINYLRGSAAFGLPVAVVGWAIWLSAIVTFAVWWTRKAIKRVTHYETGGKFKWK